ncbi:redoxin domain-containing protein [Alienimonas sp. DA493]|uniref:redoxin domain-containing protein n=1 Tax=Alienimonas sp. DA493 TaxID=3373605 RepID=UPI003754B478
MPAGLALAACLSAFQPPAAELDRPAAPDAALAPQRLLALLHAPEVHRELGLTAEQVRGLEELFTETDGPWFRSRNLPEAKQREVISGLEDRVHEWLANQASAEQRRRLRQLEYQALGTRSLFREELARQLDLRDAQRRRLAERARATDAAQRQLQQARLRGEATERLEADARAAAEAERAAPGEVLRPEQQRALGLALGEPFNVTGLTRVYPTAPELEPVEDWINSKPLTLKDLRGKVVLVHFYAFQCHNCHANFPIYNRWHETYDEDEVVVLGIQTPETARERDPAAVRAAAKERGLDFPILVDLESKNWDAWSNTMWPTVYVVDQEGYLRGWWQGELNWQDATGDETIEALVDGLLTAGATTQ